MPQATGASRATVVQNVRTGAQGMAFATTANANATLDFTARTARFRSPALAPLRTRTTPRARAQATAGASATAASVLRDSWVRTAPHPCPAQRDAATMDTARTEFVSATPGGWVQTALKPSHASPPTAMGTACVFWGRATAAPGGPGLHATSICRVPMTAVTEASASTASASATGAIMASIAARADI